MIYLPKENRISPMFLTGTTRILKQSRIDLL